MVLMSGIVIGITSRNSRILLSVEDKAILHLMHLIALSLMVWWEIGFNGQTDLKFSIGKKFNKVSRDTRATSFSFW